MTRAAWIGLVAAFSMISFQAFAYETIKTNAGAEIHWETLPVSWYMDQDGSDDVSVSETESALQASFDNWENVTCSKIKFDYKGRTDKVAPDLNQGANDGQNTMIWKETDWPSGMSEALALCLPFFEVQSGKIVDADIVFNGDWYSWSTDAEGKAGHVDIHNVAQHETGHLIGLDHPNDPDATMYYSAMEAETYKRTLAADDIQGACHLYPDPGKLAWPCQSGDDCELGLCEPHEKSGGSICTTECFCDPDCPSSLECVSRLCMPPEPQTAKIGDPCSQDAPTCASDQLCLMMPTGTGYCTVFCTDNSNCPEDWNCTSLQGGQSACTGSTNNNNASVFITAFKSDPSSGDSIYADTPIKFTIVTMASEPVDLSFRFSMQPSGGDWEYLTDYQAENSYTWPGGAAGSYTFRGEILIDESQECNDGSEDLALNIRPSLDSDDDDDSSFVPIPDDDDDSQETGGGSSSGCNATTSGSLLFGLLLVAIVGYRRSSRKNC